MKSVLIVALLLSGMLSGCSKEANTGYSGSHEVTENLPVKENRTNKPNILLILADDLGKEWVPQYGGKDVGMPNLDALAAQGVVFDNAYVNPQCTPTRLSLLTGQYPFRHGWVNHWDAPRWGHGYYDWKLNPSLGLAMRQAGYATAAAGKWQVNDFRLTPDAMDKHGFDDYLMWTGYESGVPASAERYWQPYLHSKEGSRSYGVTDFGETLFADFLLNFIDKQKADPWFVYFPMALPHTPFTSTPDEPEAEGKKAQFDAMLRYVDTILGRFLQQLDRTGQRENTLVIWMTDNGSDRSVTGHRAGLPVVGAKAKTIEAGINVPLVISAPGLDAGKRSDALIDVTDFFPTFVELANASLPDNFVFDGRSAAALLRGQSDDSEREWIMAMGGKNTAQVSPAGVENEYSFRDRVLRDKQYKLYVNSGRPLSFEKLVDVVNDPQEQTNLLDSGDPKIRAALKRLAEVAASFPEQDNDPSYRKREANSWDVPVSVESQVWKK